jgi:hypothetical protein
MHRQRATLADHLLQVIEVIELGRRTGLLSVERTSDAGLEEGDIYFVQGEAIYASTGAKSGRVALQVLHTWGACRFAFLSDVPRPMANIGPAIDGSRPYQTGPMRSIRPVPLAPPNTPQRSDTQPFGGLPTNPFQNPAGAGQTTGMRPSGYSPLRTPRSSGGGSSFWPPASTAASSSSLGLTPSHRPKRGPNPQDIPRLAASYQLSLAHRAILLMADGEHTIAELARLSRRSEEEALRLLADLLQLGLITLLP